MNNDRIRMKVMHHASAHLHCHPDCVAPGNYSASECPVTAYVPERISKPGRC
ncbi:hypothetical protein QR685DRAFT_518207 [Neurospora intermedia]|uniref:Uncharacterized protein n=1 Tax=Neurospora intermedia TaxID=5142 RepID=A0ABR3DMS3_NEUIN